MSDVGVGAQHRNAFARRTESRVGCARVKRLAPEIVTPGKVGCPGDVHRRTGCHDHAAAHGGAIGRAQRPGVGVVVEGRADDPAGSQLRVGGRAGGVVEDDDVADAGRQQCRMHTPATEPRPDDDYVVTVVAVAGGPRDTGGVGHKNLLRFQPRRAIGPSKPTSVRKMASDAKPAICISRRCGLLRAIRRARLGSRPARAYGIGLLNR